MYLALLSCLISTLSYQPPLIFDAQGYVHLHNCINLKVRTTSLNHNIKHSIMTYFPSTKNAKLAVSDVILVKPYSTSFYVTLVKENTDMIRLYPGAIYGFRVIKLKH